MKYFSAIIEPFALREAATVNGEEYGERTRNFIKGLKNALGKNAKTEVYFYVHLCFLVDSQVERLLEVLTSLRSSLLREGKVVPFTAFVSTGRAEFHSIAEDLQGDASSAWRDASITSGVYCNDVGAALFGQLTKIKAIAIALDDGVVESLSDQWKKKVFRAHYIGDYNQARLRVYNDVLFTPEEIAEKSVRKNIFKEFKQTTMRSRKLGRFFVPLLVNWCKSSPLIAKKPEGLTLTNLAIDNNLGTIRDGVGIEAVFCALLERLSLHDERLTISVSGKLVDVLKRQRWLWDSASPDGAASRFAHELLSDKARRWFASKVGELEAAKSEGSETPAKQTSADKGSSTTNGKSKKGQAAPASKAAARS